MEQSRALWPARSVFARELVRLRSPHPRHFSHAAAVLLATFAMVLGFAAPASAALTAALPTASPTDPSAMAYSNMVIDSTFGADNDDQSPRSMQFDLPKGQLGAVQNATICSDANFNDDNCAASSKIGEVLVNGKAVAIGFINIDVNAVGGIYRLATTGTEAARIGIVADDPAARPLFIVGTMRIRDTSSYGITAFVNNVPNTATADLFGMGVDVDVNRMRMTLYGRVGGGGSGNGFMFNPAECIPATTVVRAYAGVGYTGASYTANRSYTPTNCNTAPYNPSLAFGPAGTAAHTATAFNVNVTQPYNPTDAKVGSPFKRTVVNMPPGISLTGSTKSDGTLAACSDAQFSLNSLAADTCPAGADVGNVVLDSPLVGALSGDVFLAQPQAGPNDIIRLFMVAEMGAAADAVRVKLQARVEVDPATGEMTATLDNLPAQPVKSFNFTFRTSPSQAVRQPRLCGTYTGDADLTSYSSTTPLSRSGNYTVTTNCGGAGRFNPTIGMTTSPNTAGATTTGVTTIGIPVGDEALTSTTVSLPPGMIAMLQGQARCTIAQAQANTCAVGTQVGSVLAVAGQTGPGSFTGNVYLTDAPDSSSIAGLYINVPMQVGPIFVGNVAIQAKLVLRPDFGVDVVATIPDQVRGIQLDQQSLQLTFNKANFLLNPPVCTGNTVQGQFGSAQGTSRTVSSPITVTGCGSMAFAPSLAFAATPASAGGASSFTTTVTQPASTASVLQSPPKTIAVTLPTGVSLSPSANSDGALTGCSDAQFAKSTFAAPTCPAGSNVGSVVIQTPSIGRLAGNVYLGTAVGGHTARVLLDAVSDDYGARARVKLEGFLDVNETTGATTATFDGIPPVNFTSFSMALRGGTNPVLSMPRVCGTPAGSSVMTPHSGANATPSATLTIDQNCADAASFSPTFATTFSSYAAGASTAMTTTIGVPVRHRALDRISLSLPAGMLANIAGATRCSIAAANAGTCAVASKIGDVTALAGQGTAPGSFAGSLYLTDAPTAGDVVGIAVELPAVVGPVDLGKVITIASVRLRPSDYGIDVVANVPTEQKGVPLHLRQLGLQINKSGFLTSPVTCASSPVTAALRGAGSATLASVSAAYQATGCASLAFNPSLGFTAAPAAASGPSAFTTTLTAPAGGAALKKAVIDLPTGVSLSSSINSAGTLVGCSAAQFALSAFADPTCPGASDIGDATIVVPQVGTLSGDVYLASAAPSGAIAGLYIDAESPMFGPGLRVKLEGKVDVDAATGQTTATVDNAPAIAFTSFTLALRGGTAPVLSMPRACGTPAGAAALTPQSGSAVNRTANLTVSSSCGNEGGFAPTGSVALSSTTAGADTNLTTSVTVPAGGRELARLAIALPAGLLANLDGKPRCTVAAAQAGTCAASTEIGTVSATAGQGSQPGTFGGGKVYLVDAPSSSDIVGLGISLPVVVGPVDLGAVNVVASARLRPDYGIDITADVPTQLKGIPIYLRSLQLAVNEPDFLFNPSTCGAKSTALTMTSASYGGATSTATSNSATTIAGCNSVAFTPSVAFSATPAKAGGSGTFTARITLPTSPNQSALKDATVQLPSGVSLSPSIDHAGTLTGCTAAQFDLATPLAAPTCPANSRIGTTAIQTESVGAMTGDVYLATGATGHLAGLYVSASSASFPGARVKIRGVVDVDEVTGLATAVFTDAPQVPFTEFAVTFRGGDAPALSLPRTCSTPQGSATLTSHAGGAPVGSSGTLTINQNCGAPGFAPTVALTTAPTQAGAATTLQTKITLPEGGQELSRVRLSLPAGLIAKVDAHARCSVAAANAGTCAASAKIGTLTAKAGQGATGATFSGGSVYLTDAPGSGDLVGLAVELPARVGSAGGNAIVDLGKVTAVGGLALRTDYGIDLDMTVPTKVKGIPLYLRELTLDIDEAGFMVNPSTCSGNGYSGTLSAVQGGSAPATGSLAVTGCSSAAFNPSVAFSAAPARPAAASAFTTTINVPANHSPVKTAAVTLPEGVSLTASANAGGDLVGCSAGQFDAASWSDPTCPAGSKVGTVTIATPSVGAITGDAYLAATTPGGTIASLYLDAESTAFGAKVRIKASGTVAVDPGTGTTVATFDNLPGVAFSSFALTLRGGSAPIVSLPRTCGSFAGSAVLTPHAGAAATKNASLVLDQSCPAAGQFGPQVDFDLSPNGAGQAGKLTTTITVPGGDQELSRVRIDMPEGLTAKLKGAVRCTIADAQADSCAPATEVGTVVAKVGVDGAAYAQSGKVYLTEGRTGNVAGMAIVLPAVVGPIDLGKVITIADVQLKSPDLALQITADVPTSVKGVRLDLRELKLNITKDDFLVNPSSCATLPGTAAFTGKGGATASDTASITIPAGSCTAQNFDPQISFVAGNPKPGEASDFTTSVSLTDAAGPESPFKAVNVRLPEGVSLSASAGARGDLDGCTDAQFKQDDLAAASSCPAGSEIGTVKFETDLVGDLDGKAYLAPATSGNLARIFLETTAVDVPNLTVRVIGKVVVNETTGTTDAIFDEIPAIPVTKFTVQLRGGDAPTLALPRLCGPAQGTGTFVPVNGSATQTRNANLALSTDCPDPNAFSPTVTLDRSTPAAGQSMTFTTTVDVPAKQQELSSLRMVLPAGLLGKISQIPACSYADAQAGNCDAASKVGDVTAEAGVASAPFALEGAAYLVKGDSNSIARLAIVLPTKVGPVDLGDVITIAELKLRGDYGLTITANDVPTKVKGVRVDLHKLVLAINKTGFMVNPVSCTPADGTTTMGSAQGGTQVRQQTFFTTGCDQLKLNAALGFDAAPASPLTASTVTTKINASAPAGDALDAMKSVRVTLPEQTSLSASAGARGDLAECTAAEFKAADIDVDAACPAGSKVGQVGISSPMIGDLSGDVYLGAKTDGHFAGIFLQAKADEYPSLRVKLAGTLDVSETDGRMTATFTDLPQVQVSAINLQLRGGDAPVLSLPRTCGTFGADVNVLRHGGATSDATGALVLDQDCPDVSAFSPKLDLGVDPAMAGASTTLSTKITVPARHQELKDLDLAMPNGLLGRLTVAPKCNLDAARAGNCPDASLVGSASAKVGVASAPFGATGKVYLTDGFDGSIAGLMFALPAKVGPIDLGTVVTLAQINLSGNDLQMRITARDIPTRVKGIPLNISELAINVDKPGMVLNATSCGAQNAKASFGSAQGGSAASEAGYQAAGCDSLNWQPTFKVGFSGPPAEMKAKGHPTLTTVIEQAEGQGNLRSAVVTMPTGVATDLNNVKTRSCQSPDAAVAGACPDSSKLGSAEILTSALPEPVNAALYMVRIPGATLPGVAIHVRDQIAFDVIGTTRLDKSGRLVASFDGLPDTPISKMTLVFNGGSTGVLQLGKEICGVKGLTTDGTLGSHHGTGKNLSVPVDCNGTSFGGAKAPDPNAKSLASATFRPRGSSSELTFALSNPNGINKLVLKMPKGAIFVKKASKLTKLTLTGDKAKTNVVNGERRMAISIKPVAADGKVTKVKFKLPGKAIRINYKIRRVLRDPKTSKKKKAALLAKLLKPAVSVIDGNGATTEVKLTTKVSTKK